MKKIILLLTVAFAITVLANAQENAQESSDEQVLVSKKGESILPEAGDWAIGFGAAPFLNYVGNFLNSDANSPTIQFTGADMTIYGKLFIDPKTAYRLKVRLAFVSEKESYLYDNDITGFLPHYVEDEMKISSNDITIGGGLEKRRGNTRIQGIYGAELLFSYSSFKTTYDYAESLSDAHLIHVNYFGPWGQTEYKAGNTLGVTLRGFIGAEIFVFPKVSVAAEFGWGLKFSSTSEGQITEEDWDYASASATQRSLIETKIPIGKKSDFGIDNDNSGGNLILIFHF